MTDLLKSADLIELHKKLDEFASHHQQKGAEKAFDEVVRMRDEHISNPQDGSNEGQIANKAYRQALTDVIEKLRPF